MQDEAFQQEVAGMKAAMSASIDRHPAETPFPVRIDPLKSMLAVPVYERGQVVVLLYPDTTEPEAMGSLFHSLLHRHGAAREDVPL
jgi:hypothetical protein